MGEHNKEINESKNLNKDTPELETSSLGQSTKPTTLKSRASSGTVVVVMLACVAGFLGGLLGSYGNNGFDGTEVSDQTKQQIVSSESEVINQIAKDIGPSVVSIDVMSQETVDFFGFARPIDQQSAGTGFIISEDGYVLTNRHVIPAGTTSVSVTLSDGTKLDDVEVIGRTNDSDPLDIAFLKINDKKDKTLVPVKLADSSKVEVGDKAIAIGNALGQFQNTVTAGIISGYGRSIEAGDGSGGATESLVNLFQTDAAINFGNSGGPLVNISGEVMGVNTAVAGDGAENIGFAIPINDVKGLVTGVLKNGKLERPYLGIRYVSITDDYAYEYNLPVKRGAYIPISRGQSAILNDSPASKAGLKEKDIILKVDGVTIDEKNSLTSLLGQKPVGETVTLTILRDGKEIEVKATLEAAPSS